MKIDLQQFNNAGFDRGASRLKELLWWVVRTLVFNSSFPIPSPVKVFFLKCFGSKIGKRVVIRSRTNITFPWRLELGNDVWIGDEVLILSLAKVTIGSSVCISQRSFICTGSHDFQAIGFDLITKPIKIHDGCWLGAQCFVGPGVEFGESSRCLAGAVVVRDVRKGDTVGGVPAKSLSKGHGVAHLDSNHHLGDMN